MEHHDMEHHETQKQQIPSPAIEDRLMEEGFQVITSYDLHDQDGFKRYNNELDKAKKQGKKYTTTRQGYVVTLWIK